MTTKPKSSITPLVGDVRKADTKALITDGADAFPEDNFEGLYWTGGATDANAIIEPQYKPGVLYTLASQNNTLYQCIEAMEVNIDGTGHYIKLKEGEEEDEEERKRLENFFAEPFPGKSMIEIRRACRRDLETTGNAYMEVIRNAADEIMMINYLEATTMRLVRLGDAIEADKVIIRDGKPTTVRIRTRERRFVQLVNGKKLYFKEYGASRDLDRNTGEWAPPGVRLPIDQRASEVLHLIGNKEPKTPYGAPRWINQLPSVLGSRKAEEHNLEFFDGGGIPPVLVIVQGGTLGEDVKNDLKNHLSGKSNKHRAAVVEAISTSGSLDSAGTVQVRVERFGSERQQDSMFQSYDKTCSENIRTAFRLPPLFIGKSGDMNFATAYTSYMVAEAQVFFPERDEFDSVINTKLVRGLGATKYEFKSLPMTLVDVQNQLKAIDMAHSDGLVSGKSMVKMLNDITGLTMEYDPTAKPPQPTQSTNPSQQSSLITGPILTNPQETGTGTTFSLKSEQALDELAEECVKAIVEGVSPHHQAALKERIAKLEPASMAVFNTLVASRLLSDIPIDLKQVDELCQCADHLVGE